MAQSKETQVLPPLGNSPETFLLYCWLVFVVNPGAQFVKCDLLIYCIATTSRVHASVSKKTCSLKLSFRMAIENSAV